MSTLLVTMEIGIPEMSDAAIPVGFCLWDFFTVFMRKPLHHCCHNDIINLSGVIAVRHLY